MKSVTVCYIFTCDQGLKFHCQDSEETGLWPCLPFSSSSADIQISCPDTILFLPRIWVLFLTSTHNPYSAQIIYWLLKNPWMICTHSLFSFFFIFSVRKTLPPLCFQIGCEIFKILGHWLIMSVLFFFPQILWQWPSWSLMTVWVEYRYLNYLG